MIIPIFKLKKKQYHLYGYPTPDVNKFKQYKGSGTVSEATPLHLKYGISKIVVGTSGSPVFDSREIY